MEKRIVNAPAIVRRGERLTRGPVEAIPEQTARRLKEALARREISLSPEEILAILEETKSPESGSDASDSADTDATLSESEKKFLVENSALTPEDLTDEALRVAGREADAIALRVDKKLRTKALTTTEVAAMIGTPTPNIRRSVSRGNLYVIGKNANGEYLFPRWQFLGEKAVPGLGDVLKALPENYHPLNVSAFMTTGNPALNGMTPVVWLGTGGKVGAVVKLATERAWV